MYRTLGMSLLILGVFVVSSSSFGEDVNYYKHGPYPISRIQAHGDKLQFILNGASAMKSTCNGNRFKFNVTDANYESKKTLLTAAFMGQKTVTVYLRKDSPVNCAAVADIVEIHH